MSGGKQFERCPKCSKKGVYISNGYPFWGCGTVLCRYCHKIWTQGPEGTWPGRKIWNP